MRIAVLGNDGSWYVDDLQRAARDRGHVCERIDYGALVAEASAVRNTVVSGDEDLAGWDAVVIRTMPPGSLEQVVFRMDALHRLQDSGVQVLNSPRAIECAVDKYLTTARLARDGLAVPATVACEGFDQAMAAFERLGGDVVVKPLFGAEGRGIVRVSDPDIAHRVFRTLERIGAVLYLQQFIRHPGWDLRLLLLDGRPLGAIRRSNPHDFRTNISREGHAEVHTPDDREVEYAIRAAESTQTRFAGVDLLYGPDGTLYVIEVNAVPGWRGFQKATGLDVAERVVGSIERFS